MRSIFKKAAVARMTQNSQNQLAYRTRYLKAKSISAMAVLEADSTNCDRDCQSAKMKRLDSSIPGLYINTET